MTWIKAITTTHVIPCFILVRSSAIMCWATVPVPAGYLCCLKVGFLVTLYQIESRAHHSNLCLSAAVRSDRLWRLFLKVKEMQLCLTSFESHYLVNLQSVESFVMVLSCCDNWSCPTSMNSTFKSIYEVLLIPLNFLPFDTKCVFCPKRVSAEIHLWNYI